MRGVVRIPAEAEGKLLVVVARVGGEAYARLVVDSGAGTSALSLHCARRLGLRVDEHLRVRTPTGLVAVGTFALPSLCVGPLEVADFRLAAVPLHNDRVDGLLGLDFFRAVGAVQLTLLLDTTALEVRLA
ncbi:MAG: retroviral-like aspartic protease family protein [Chloroflexota bacterium]|nr:retroviral-like aspartic protease family protein [Chloroflexota bacterium]